MGRYQFKGKPLFYNQDLISEFLVRQGPPPCPLCGSKRVFECQLMPAALRLLTKNTNNNRQTPPVSAEQSILNALAQEPDLGTILIYCCEKDCEPEDSQESLFYATEFVAVQLEVDE